MRWWRPVWNRLKDKSTIVTLLFVVSSGVTVGMVPTIAEALLDTGSRPYLGRYWTLAGIAAFIAVGCWTYRIDRGVGVVVQLFPNATLDVQRLEKLRATARQRQGSAFTIHPARHLGDAPENAGARVALAAHEIGARVAEAVHGGREGEVYLYPLAMMPDGFKLGAALRTQEFDLLEVMHVSRKKNRRVVPGVVLSDELEKRLSDIQTRVLLTRFARTTAEPELVSLRTCPEPARRRLAVVANVTGDRTMQHDAEHVITHGTTEVAGEQDDDGVITYRHTGYALQRDSPQGPQAGAYVAIDLSREPLTERPRWFGRAVRHVFTVADRVRNEWARTTAQDPRDVEILLFISAPVAIVIALGWALSRWKVDVVRHNLGLAGRTRTERRPETL
ncbi:hypothetical protein ACFT2C_06140 [Promicromonospora sp. NPDC057138]|uniref:hypothetical protein n=1 Tax=Promicromonospora sp. NPDC057138 TaxID=3346031 RepID=UPI00362F56CF